MPDHPRQKANAFSADIIPALERLYNAVGRVRIVPPARPTGRRRRQRSRTLYAAWWQDLGSSRLEIGAAIDALLNRKPVQAAVQAARNIRAADRKKLEDLADHYLKVGRAEVARIQAAVAGGEALVRYEEEEHWKPEERLARFVWFMQQAIAVWLQREEIHLRQDHELQTSSQTNPSENTGNEPSITRRSRTPANG